MSLTAQQQTELFQRVTHLVHITCDDEASKAELRVARERLLDFVDRLADARVVNFAQATLQAAKGIDGAGRAYDAQAVVVHLSNTLEQYTQLGLIGAKS